MAEESPPKSASNGEQKTEPNTGKVWINPEILNWHPVNTGGVDVTERNRSYEHWKHADQLAASAKSELDWIDVIATLYRAIDLRVMLLNKTYRFKSIPISNKPKELYELMAYLGIIRPLVLKSLHDIRDRVEHQDARPPDPTRRTELIEFAWYFLRSTDCLLRGVGESLELYPTKGDDERHELMIGLLVDNQWSLSMRGWLSTDYIVSTNLQDWIEIELIETRNAREFKEKVLIRFPNFPFVEKMDADLYIAGKLLGPAHQIRRIFQIYFESM